MPVSGGVGRDRHDETTAGARPGTKLGVPAVRPADETGIRTVGSHDPDLGAHAAVEGDRAREPRRVGRPAHRDHGVRGEGDRGRLRLRCLEHDVLHPEFGNAAAVTDERDPVGVGRHVGAPSARLP